MSRKVYKLHVRKAFKNHPKDLEGWPFHGKSGKNKNTQQSVDLNNLLRRYAKILFTDAKWFGRQSLASLKMSSALDSKYQPPGRCKRLHPKWLEQYVDWKKSKPFWVGWKYSHLQLLHRNCFGHSSDFTLTDVPVGLFCPSFEQVGSPISWANDRPRNPSWGQLKDTWGNSRHETSKTKPEKKIEVSHSISRLKLRMIPKLSPRSQERIWVDMS